METVLLPKLFTFRCSPILHFAVRHKYKAFYEQPITYLSTKQFLRYTQQDKTVLINKYYSRT